MLKKAFLAGLSLVALLAFSSIHGADASANYLTVDMACSLGGGVDVQVAWAGASSVATQQWLDVSLQNDGWRQGTFSGIGPIAPAKTAIVASALMPNAIYFVRINQLLPGSYWDASPTFFFRTPPDCARVLAKPTLIVTSTTSGGSSNNNSGGAGAGASSGSGNGNGNGGAGSGNGGGSSSSGSSTTSDKCHPDYYGACLKPDSVDYDCEGGGGDGPDFVKGPVYLTSKADPFELDKDGDGIGCNE